MLLLYHRYMMIIEVCLNLGVPPDRQKVMFAGVTLTDHDWGKAKVKIKDVSDVHVHKLFTVSRTGTQKWNVTWMPM